MQIVKAPAKWDAYPNPFVFLSGSIEMGTAMNWQTRVEEALKNLQGTILNPRRDDWDSSWIQSMENPQFREQVEWELTALESSHVVGVYFDPTTKSPITLLELGLLCERSSHQALTVFICCPEGFWRKGNVDIVCNRYNIPTFNSLDQLIVEIAKYVTKWH